jgi:putative ABC transport system permease protein
LRVLALIVAAVGILAALMSIQLERSKEFALLRVVGMTPTQLFRLIAIETGIMGAVAAVLSIPIGMLLAWVLVRVINRRSFGWSIDMSIAPEVIMQTVLLAITVALLAAVYPALRGAGVQPALALREE